MPSGCVEGLSNLLLQSHKVHIFSNFQIFNAVWLKSTCITMAVLKGIVFTRLLSHFNRGTGEVECMPQNKGNPHWHGYLLTSQGFI